MMKTSQRGLAEIAAHEGLVLSPYRDSVGVWTVGIGHTAAAGEPDPATERREFSVDEIMEIFARDIEKFETRVRDAFTRPLTQTQFDAAVSFDFNTGAVHRASWVQHFNNNDPELARDAFMAWRKPKEIIPRRKKERDLFFDGTYSGDGFVNVYPAAGDGQVLWSQGRRAVLPETSRAPVPDLPTPPVPVAPHPTPRRSFEMPNMKGFRTVIANVLTALVSIAAIYGIDIPPEQVDEVALGIVSAFSILNVVMRSITNTPMGQSGTSTPQPEAQP